MTHHRRPLALGLGAILVASLFVPAGVAALVEQEGRDTTGYTPEKEGRHTTGYTPEAGDGARHDETTGLGDPFAWVDSVVGAEALARGVPGVAVAIVHDGRILLQRGYGIADLETGRAVDAATPFNIASVTKPFTSALALRFAEEGVVGLDDPLGIHLPDVPDRYHAVTLRQLLTHTSGVDRDLREDNADDPDETDYRARVDTASVHAAPGERWEYANNGYTLLGWALESAAGESLTALFERYFFSPLGMRQARYREPLERGRTRARPYGLEAGEPTEIGYVTGGFASGGLAMSIADLAIFAAALSTDAILSASARADAWKPAQLADGSEVSFDMMGPGASYGMGWFLTRYEGRRLLTHGGGIEGFSANVYHFPDEGLSIAVLANTKARDDGRAPVDPLSRALASMCLQAGRCEAGDSETRERHEALDAANRAFSTAYLAGDTVALANAYTEAAFVMPPRGRLVVGDRAAGRRFANGGRPEHLEHALYAEWRLLDGDRALEAGTWYDVWAQGGEPAAASGRYVLSWERGDDGRWRMTSDSWQVAGATRED